MKQRTPAEAAVVDIREPKSVDVPSEAPPSELGFTRQLLKDGGDEKVVPPPGRNDGSEKLRKSEGEGAEEVLVALVNRPGGEKGGEAMERRSTRQEEEAATHRKQTLQLGKFPFLSSEQQQTTKRSFLSVQEKNPKHLAGASRFLEQNTGAQCDDSS